MQSFTIKQIIIKGLAFIILIVTTFVGIHFLLPAEQNSYLAALIDKHTLLESTPGARVIMAGGSNIAFGLDSERLACLINKPVINDGLHGELGIRFILNDLTPFLHSGDLVILIPEYTHFYSDYLEGDSLTLSQLLDIFPQAVQSLEISQFYRILGSYIPILRSKIVRWISPSIEEDPIYNRSGFNHYGDVISHLGKPSNPNITSATYIREKASLNLNAIIVFNRFARQAKSKGAMVYLVYPASRNTNCLATGSRFENLDNYLRSQLDFPILSHPGDSCIDDDFFFNTAYHLNAAGRQLRTSELANLLVNQGVIKVDPEYFSSCK